jgi:hypothetical protein
MFDDSTMRTTLDIDDDVLQAAKALAEARKKTAGQVISELARQALQPKTSWTLRNGVPVLPRVPGARVMTDADIRRWLDEDD